MHINKAIVNHIILGWISIGIIIAIISKTSNGD